jgi:hypothetical protein
MDEISDAHADVYPRQPSRKLQHQADRFDSQFHFHDVLQMQKRPVTAERSAKFLSLRFEKNSLAHIDLSLASF